jgi:tetratricopeptide (TPR) repeat protein
MVQRLRCDNGHEWEVGATALDQTADFTPLCPSCREPGRQCASTIADAPVRPGPTDETLAPRNGRAADAGPVAVVGYQVLQELGRGGMGVVYLARQEKLNRLVALKMVLAGRHAGDRDRDRFRREAEAVARLQHPNIVQIYEVGEADGRPYFSLEYVDGGTLAARLDGTPLPAHDAAALIVPLARAVEAAHGCGIVHRDLKPGNILLASSRESPADTKRALLARCTPKITDFGLAKDLESADGQTQTGAVLGTPSYMAPEQASGHTHTVGPAADVYALGAILYELLTGRPPFLGATPLDTVMQAVSDEPVRPRHLQPKVPVDLETICLKCLQKEPRKRYESAGALADDLQRFVAGEPIRARPVGPLARGWRWAKRHPAVAALLTVLTAVIVGSFLVVLALLRQSELRRAQAERAEEQAKKQEARAKQNLLMAVEAVDRMLTRVVDERLQYIPQFEDERRQILEEAVGFYNGFLEQEHSDPTLRREMGRAYFRLGKVFGGLGKPDKSQDSFRQAQTLQEQLAAEFPDDPMYRNDLALTFNELATAVRTNGHVDRAEPLYQRAHDLATELVRQSPDELKFRETLAKVLQNLGYMQFQRMQLDRAETFFKQSITEYDELLRRKPGDYHYRLERANATTSLAYYQLALNRFGPAEQNLNASLAELDKLLREFPDKRKEIEPAAANARLNLAQVYTSTNRAAEADSLLRSGMATYTRLVNDYPLSPTYRFQLARGHQAVAISSRLTEKPQKSEEALSKAIVILEKLDRDNPEAFYHGMMLRNSYRDLAQLYRSQKRFDEAYAELRKAIKSADEDLRTAPAGVPLPFEIGNMRLQLAQWLAADDKVPEAIKELDTGIAQVQPRVNGNPRTQDVLKRLRVNRAIFLARAGDHVAALAEARRLAPPGETIPANDFGRLYNLACVHALCSQAIRADTSIASAEREKLAEAQAAQAMELLRKVGGAGYFQRPQGRNDLRTDADLNPLRGRPDFRTLLEEVVPKPAKTEGKYQQ